MVKIKKFFSSLGPGVITGASDDDPSGIATYSIAGAQAQYSTLWTTLFTFPLMSGIQEMAARIGIVTGKGLAGVMRVHYPKPVVLLIAAVVGAANIINIGADLAGMAAASRLIVDIHPIIDYFFHGFCALSCIYQVFEMVDLGSFCLHFHRFYCQTRLDPNFYSHSVASD